MGNLYWSIVILALGGCIGSFLNVVIYRWPRDLSVRQPSRSFCPNCETSIAWYDNIPVISYILLRGRCRHCGCAISLQYPLVELATAFVFLMAYDAFFVTHMREGVGTLSSDWPILLSHWFLFGGLIALSVMDLEAYMVDIRLTWIITLVGLITHTLWTPASSLTHESGQVFIQGLMTGVWIRPGQLQSGLAFGAAIGLLVGFLLFLRGREDHALDLPEEQEPVEEPLSEELPAALQLNWQWLWLIGLSALVIVYLVVMLKGTSLATQTPAFLPGNQVDQQAAMPPDTDMMRLMAGIAAAFVALALVASHPQPQADADIMDVIESEADSSRSNALREILLLLPAILCGIGAFVAILLTDTTTWNAIGQVLHWSPTGEWQPLWGFSTGLVGWIIGGAIGWLARIVFTLAFRKEALGMGDVHILAAAGAVAGWPVALLGFFMAAPLALLGIVVICLRRQSRALPYGPWLALAFFAAGLFQDRILRYLHIRWMLE